MASNDALIPRRMNMATMINIMRCLNDRCSFCCAVIDTRYMYVMLKWLDNDQILDWRRKTLKNELHTG